MKLARASIVLAVSLFYFAHVFQLTHETFWKFGLGDWMDPYFINALLEHWGRSVWSFKDPTSPPMYFPVGGTLGYSHGLILYAPFYVAVRPFLHPFQAHGMTLLLVMEVGVICLYLIFRKFHRLSLVESLLLCAFFFTSRNVIGGETGIWSQRASVFLIPPILLIVFVSVHMPEGRLKVALAWLSGLLSTLLFTQDFYTGQFALLLAILAVVGVVFVDGRVRVIERMKTVWRKERSLAVRAALVTAALTGVWTAYLLMFGGGTLQVLDVKIRSHDWRRPALAALAAVVVLVRLRGVTFAKAAGAEVRPWLVAFALGAFMGCTVFAWIYLPPYLEHRGFPEDDLMDHLTARDPSRWQGPLDVLRDLGVYNSLRSFTLVVVLGIFAWVPWLNLNRDTRLYSLWFLVISLVVLIVPLRLDDFSAWKTFFRPLPGFSAIRDPKRIIHLYELAVVLVTALFLTQLPRKSPVRRAIALLLLVLIATDWNRDTFAFIRRTTVYDRWVAAPVEIDASCRSFFMKGASGEYMARSADMPTLYGIDSLFVSLNHSIPTLNGYSAWSPDGWNLGHPYGAGYPDAVRRWIERHGLTGVCEFDIDARTMKPYGLP